MGDEPVTLESTGRQLASIQAERRWTRTDMDTVTTLVAGQTDILVAGFKGCAGISRPVIERRLGDLAERVGEAEAGKSRFTP